MSNNFSLYDALSQLFPGCIVYIAMLKAMQLEWDKDYIVPATMISFFIGYFVSAISGWLENFYYYTWSGKPSSQLLKGKSIRRVKFYHADEVRSLAAGHTETLKPTEDELFTIILRYTTSVKDSRIETFANNYAFSRAVLTTCLIVWLTLFSDWSANQNYIFAGLAILFMAWIRCKERAYYYAKEVLQTYLRLKKPI